MNEPTDITALVAAFVTAATEPHPLPAAPVAEHDAVFRPLRRSAQRRFDVDGLPRGLRLAA